MTPRDVLAKLRRGSHSIDDIARLTGATRVEAEHAVAMFFTGIKHTGQAMPRWNHERGCHLYPCGDLL